MPTQYLDPISEALNMDSMSNAELDYLEQFIINTINKYKKMPLSYHDAAIAEASRKVTSKLWKDPEFVAKQQAGMEKLKGDSTWVANKTRASKRNWTDKAYRKKTLNAIREATGTHDKINNIQTLLNEGMGTRPIAEKLNINRSTVQYHLRMGNVTRP